VGNEEVLHIVKEGRSILKQQKEGRLTGLVTSCIGPAFLKRVIEGEIEGRI
jgi:hypothetical protein